MTSRESLAGTCALRPRLCRPACPVATGSFREAATPTALARVVLGWTREQLEKDFPRKLAIGDARYRIAYDVARKLATLHQVSGNRKQPPPDQFLPRLPGWRLAWEHKNRVRMIRGR